MILDYLLINLFLTTDNTKDTYFGNDSEAEK